MTNNMKVNILGTEYTILIKKLNEEKIFDECDGYTDWTLKTICVLDNERSENTVGDIEAYKRKVLRHEITHAFFIESGLMGHANQSEYGGGAYDEQIVDWIAIQGSKIYEAWRQTDCLG